jgi:hypothetical protein
MITKEQFVEWKTHPVTIEVYEEVVKAKQDLLKQLLQGVTIGQKADVTHGLTNRLIGQTEGLDQLLNLTYEDE